MEKFIGRVIFVLLYRSRSIAGNQRQFSKGVEQINAWVHTYEDHVLQGRENIGSMPGIIEVMQDWSPYMTIHHLNLVHRAIIDMIHELEAGRPVEIGDLSRFDDIDPKGEEVMKAFNDLAQEVIDLPEKVSFSSDISVTHPFFGTLTSKGYYAVLAMHLQLHVDQIKKSIRLNTPSKE